MISREEVNRMQWAARRGMLELDLVLAPFVAQRYAHLDEQDRQRFADLMHCEDQDLFAWLLQRAKPEGEDAQAIVSLILEFTHTPPADR